MRSTAVSVWNRTPAQLFEEFSNVLGRRRRRGTPHPEEIRLAVMSEMALRFECLRGAFGLEPWQTLSFIAWLNRPANQENPAAVHAGRFLLSVWGPRTNWAAEGLAGWVPFSLDSALEVWSTMDRLAFERWLDYPFWP